MRFILLFIFIPSVLNAQVKSRLIEKIEFERLLTLSDVEIYKPTLFTVDKDDYSFIYDYGNHKIYKIGSGSLDKSFGEGLGGGPKEFRNPTALNYDISEDNIWLSDPSQARISIWDNVGHLVKTLAFDNSSEVPIESYPISKDKYVWRPKNYFENGAELMISSIDNSVLQRLGKIEGDVKWAKFRLDGNIEVDSSGIYYVGFNSSFIKKYLFNGELKFNVRGIEPISDPQIEQKKLSVQGLKNVRINKIEEDHPIAYKDLEIYNGKIYLLFSGLPTGESHLIDVYGKEDGKYLFSYKSDEKISKIEINNGNLFAIIYSADNNGEAILAKYIIE